MEAGAVARFLCSKTVMPAPEPDRSIISKDKLKKILENVKLTVTLTKADVSFDPILECDIDISWFKLKRFLFAIGGNLVCGIEFQIDVTAATDLPLKSELEIFHSKPYVFSVGPVPCSFEWDINCGVDAAAGVTGSYKYANDWTFAVRVGAEYDGSQWRKFNDIKRTSSAKDDYELKGSIEIKPYLNVGFALKVCGVAGPKIYLEVFLSYLAEMASLYKVDITVSAGVGAQVSFVLEIFSWTVAEFKAELFSISWEIYKRSINFKVEDPVMTPGGGSYSEDQKVVITSSTAGAMIRYTLDGSDPSPSRGTLYDDPITVSRSMTIKAVAYLSANRYSSITTADYAIRDIYIPPTPESDFGFEPYKTDSSTGETLEYICGYFGKGTTASVPATYNGKKVTRYKGGNYLEALKLPEGIEGVFYSEQYYSVGLLKKIIIPSTAKSIYLYSCPLLYDVRLAEGIESIDYLAFSMCKSLSSLVLPSTLKTIGERAFYGCGLKTIAIPDSVTTIGEAAFVECTSLSEIKYSSSMTYIPRGCFRETAVTSVRIPDAVTEIGGAAFFNCSKLKTVTFGKGLVAIKTMAFAGCPVEEFYFEGDAPKEIDGLPYGDFKIYFKKGTMGWTTPTWNGYPTFEY